jgi:hypothetical protein
MSTLFWAMAHSAASAEPESLSVTVTPGGIVNLGAGNGTLDYEFTAAGVGGTAPYTYQWTIDVWSGTASILSGATSATCTVRTSGTDSWVEAQLTCTVTDAATDTAVQTVSIVVQFGAGTPP